MSNTRILILLGFTTMIGCGGRQPNRSAGDGGVDSGGVIVTPGSVSLAASSSMETGSSGESTSYTVTVSVGNGLSDAISVAPSLFRMRAGALEHPARLDAALANGCPLDSLLASGATIECGLSFQVASGLTPSAIVMTTPEGSIEATTTATPCTRCGDFCTDLMTSQSNCGVCGRESPSNGSCENGVPTCPAGKHICNGYCDNSGVECSLHLDTRRIACETKCQEIDLHCVYSESYYMCSDTSSASDESVGCNDEPPPNLADCGPFDNADCRCSD
ncbi:MAG: hypothetical protein IPK60_24735 [Sandaracinaceae bacterium]|jgi:hypothetical protein|nr:hypothetical protein [Sandaracinaceae bacterium]